ncbi:MAG: hypothetical protein IJV94_02765 [Bacilli bacterium]|nr:hypothetical protein [Bacilli bacterium]
MFSLREFIKKGLLDAVGKMADYQVILNAAAWNEKGVLLEEDLIEINTAIDNQYIVVEEENDLEEEFEVTETYIIEE